jgi:hypothetical protein
MGDSAWEFPTKPDLTLYIGRYVQGIVKPVDGEPWEWGIRLDNGVEIRNKDRKETFVPTDIVGKQVTTITYSVHDTTIIFTGGLKWSLNPTQYALHDPNHGGEVYPQWPENLEEVGIPSHPEEAVSDKPENPEEWERHRQQLLHEADARHQSEAQEFLKEEDA